MLITGARNERIQNWYQLKEILSFMMGKGNVWKDDDAEENWVSDNQELKNVLMESAEVINFENLKLFVSDERNSEIATWENMVKQVHEDDDVEGLLYSIIVNDFRLYILYRSEKNLFENDDEIFENYDIPYDEDEVF